MASTDERIPIILMFYFAPDKWGEVTKFRNFSSSTYRLPPYAIIALRGIEGHFEKYFILMGLAQNMIPKLVEDHEELATQGYSRAIRSKELAAIIDTLFCELYSVVDCTRPVLASIYGNLPGISKKSTHKLFENAEKSIIDERVPLEIRNALIDAQNNWFPRLKKIRDSINHFGIGSCSENEGKISYYHDMLGKTISNVLVTDDVFQEISKYEGNVNEFLERVFCSLNLTLDDNETIQICGLFGGLLYQRTVSISEANDFNSGRCKSFESFEKGSMPKCPCISSCGAYARVLEQRDADN